MEIAKSLFRIAYGAWFAFWGIAPLIGVASPPVENAEAVALMEANGASFPLALAHATFVLGGLALIWKRTAPLGIAILAPTVTWILLFHTTLTASVAWGAFWFAGLLVLAWWHRAAFVPLVTWSSDRQPA